MKLLYKGDRRVIKIIEKKKLRPDAKYRLSHFVHTLDKDGRIILRSTLSKQIYELTEAEWTALKSKTLADENRDALARVRILVEENYDEYAQYIMTLSALRSMSVKPSGIGNYTILPTTACNARCIYCYEEGIKPVNMTLETADAVTDYILRTKRRGRIHLSWFGGEPLLGAPVISHICQSLLEKGVEFDSSLTTNGSLLTPEIAREARELWHLTRVQMSMDGVRSDYEARKKYADPSRFNYDTAMKSLELFSDTVPLVIVRCNYDSGNLLRLNEFFSECRERFKDRNNIHIYMAPLFQSITGDQNEAYDLRATEAENSLDRSGLALEDGLEMRLRYIYCMADPDAGSLLIDPSGNIHFCEHNVDDEAIGSVFDATAPVRSELITSAEEICRDCCYLPDCTPFRRRYCPVKFSRCKEATARHAERLLMYCLKRIDEDRTEATEEEEADTPEETLRDTLC